LPPPPQRPDTGARSAGGRAVRPRTFPLFGRPTRPALPVTATVIAAPSRSTFDAVSARRSPRQSPDSA
jgi:hypothetical protein